MFEPTDERLTLLRYRAGYYAFFAMWPLMFAMFFSLAFYDFPVKIASGGLFFILLPWYVGMFVYHGFLIAKKFNTGTQELRLRTDRGLKQAKTTVTGMSLIFGLVALIFVNPLLFSGTGWKIALALLIAAAVATGQGLLLWWLTIRKPKVYSGEDE